ncbi:MAG: hybrid sensor histidine kinase/response regulator [Magnetococcales bacterium]|nr:hybrid sensor histidine kinase/response regulator [Magnetococcales bacterium]
MDPMDFDQNGMARLGLVSFNEEEVSSTNRLRQEIRTLHQAAEITADLVIHQFEKTEAILAKFQATSGQLQAVLDAASQIAIIATDLTGSITLFNRGAEVMLGYLACEVIGRMTPLDLHHIEDFSSSVTLEKLIHLATSEQGAIQEWLYRRKDGQSLPVTVSVTPLLGSNRHHVGFLWVAMDITPLKQAEEQLRRSNVELQRLDKLKSDLLSSVSHELRTPLTSIRGFAQLIRREFDRTFAATPEDDVKRRTKSSRIQDNLDIILTESERLTRLINEVLDLAKIESGRIEWHKVHFSLQEAILQAVNAVQGQFAGLANVALETNLPSSPLMVDADKDRMVQVLVNLLNNAAKFIQAGYVRVSAIRQPDGWVRVEVQDTGCGFPPEQAETIFDKFQQVHRNDTLVDKPQGTGLGLSICREIVLFHGGRIWATSVPGQGSTFSLTLPLLAQSEESDLMAESELLSNHTIHDTPVAPSVNECSEQNTQKSLPLVLVIDDDANVCTYLNLLFLEQGYRVMTARDGQEGLEMARLHHPDLITLDLAMPVLDGRQTMVHLHQDPKLSQIPVIVLSAMPDFDQVGGSVAMSKPIDEQRLLLGMRLLLLGRKQDLGVESMPCLALNEPVPLASNRLPGIIRVGDVVYCDREELLRRVGEGFKGLVTVPTEALHSMDGTFWEQLSSLDVLILPAAQKEEIDYV